MAKIMVMQCDLCEKTSEQEGKDGKKLHVQTHRVALDQDAVDLEACDDCWWEVRHRAVDNLFDVGRPVPRRGPRKKNVTDGELPEQGKRGPGRPRKNAEPGLTLAKR